LGTTRLEIQAPLRFKRSRRGQLRDMYIGLGTLVVILIIVLIIYFVRRA
jgi:hypothetical protein